MFRMVSPSLMKTPFVGTYGARTLPLLNGEGGGGVSCRIALSERAIGGRLRARLRGYFTREAAVRRQDSPKLFVQTRLDFWGKRSLGPSAHHLLPQGSAGFEVFSSASRQSAALGMDQFPRSEERMDEFVDVAHRVADAAGEIIRELFRTKIDILDKDDSSPVTVADRRAEGAMTLLLKQHFPSHGIYGEEAGLHMPDERTEYTWVLDPIDGTKSFITGKPLFGTLIALLHKGIPILGVIDQPILRERWVGREGKTSTLNGELINSRSSTRSLEDAYLYTTSPHLFSGSKEDDFIRLRKKVKTPLYGCDCYAYGLLAAGHVDLVVESGLKPYDFLALVPVIEGAGGCITDWQGQSLRFWPNTDYPSSGEDGTDVVAAGSKPLHKAALAVLAS